MTDLEKQRKERYNRTAKGQFKFIVIDKLPGKATMISEYDTIEQVLHKVKLDLMTHCNYPGMINASIEIKLKLKEDTGFKDHRYGKKEDAHEK